MSEDTEEPVKGVTMGTKRIFKEIYHTEKKSKDEDK